MLLHSFTLHHVLAELLANAQNSYCTECFTQEKNTLHFVFEGVTTNSQGDRQTKQTCVLECHLDSRHGAVFLKENFHRARKNTLDCFPELIGRNLADAHLLSRERVLVLSLPPFTLYCIVFAGWNQSTDSSPSNAVCTNADGIIVNAFRVPQSIVGKSLTLRDSGLQTWNEILSNASSETPISTVLARDERLSGSIYAREVCARLGLEGSEVFGSDQVQEHIEDISIVTDDVRHECLSSKRFFILRQHNKLLLSMIHLIGSEVVQEFSSISAAIQEFISLEGRELRFRSIHTLATERVETMLRKAERALEHITRDTDGGNRAMERQVWAELLLSQENIHEKGLESIKVENYDGELIEIRLNPALTLRQNAEELFAKAARAKEATKKREIRQRQYVDEIKRLKHFQEIIAHVNSEQECEKIMNDLQKNAPNTSQHVKTTRFREFPLDDKHTLYVGKTAADNDELTVRFAKPNDYWFHARGVPGSHAVLRSPNSGTKKPPKIVLEQAAAIAAFFSKARNAKLTPVAYTQKKYVRKPKGAAVGAVVIEREEVIMVRPHIPEGLLNSSNGDDVT